MLHGCSRGRNLIRRLSIYFFVFSWSTISVIATGDGGGLAWSWAFIIWLFPEIACYPPSDLSVSKGASLLLFDERQAVSPFSCWPKYRLNVQKWRSFSFWNFPPQTWISSTFYRAWCHRQSSILMHAYGFERIHDDILWEFSVSEERKIVGIPRGLWDESADEAA